MANNVTLTEVIDLLSELFTNLNNLDKTYYDMFYNTTPMDITLERYDEKGVLQKVVLPNRAKDKDSVIVGSGDPEGVVAAGVGKLYLDGDNGYLYYKTQGTAIAPTVSGWTLIYTTVNAGDFFQLKEEKGKPDGYAPLNAQGKIPAEYLTATDLTYYDTKETCFVEIAIKTILTYACSNIGLDFEVTYSDTRDDIGVETVEFVEQTKVTHPINTEQVTATGTLTVDDSNGKVSGFSTDNYLTTDLLNTEFDVTLGTVNQEVETLLSVNNHNVTVTPSTTTTVVNTNREDLKAVSTFTGVKPIGTEEDRVFFKDKLTWYNSVCIRQGQITIDNHGVANNFSADNYLAPITNWQSTTATLDIKFATSTDITTGQVIIGNNMSVAIKDGYLGYNKLTDKTFEQVVAVEPEHIYYLKISYDETKSSNVVKYSTDGSAYTEIVPAEAGNLFLLGTYAIGKGILDGQSNVPFLGTVYTTDSSVTNGALKSVFSEVTKKWYDLEDVETTLDAHQLAISSGEPADGDVITIVYRTNKPSINSQEVELGETYKFKYVNDENNPFIFYPRIKVNNEWVSAGEAVTASNTDVNIGKGVFNGSVNLLDSTQDITTTTIVKNYTEVGTLSYSAGIASGFSEENYISKQPIPSESVKLVFTTGTDITTSQKLLANLGETGNNLHIDTDSSVKYTLNNVAYSTNLTVTASTNYYLSCSKVANVWGIKYSTDNQTWTDLTWSNAGETSSDFTALFTDTALAIGQGFLGTVNVLSSTLDDTPMYQVNRAITTPGTKLAKTVITYHWLNIASEEVNLDDYGIKLISGTPATGDTLILTYTTTEY